MNRTAQGILAILAACVIWGLSPLYYNLLTMVPPLELLAQRTLWSFLFFALSLFSVMFYIQSPEICRFLFFDKQSECLCCFSWVG